MKQKVLYQYMYIPGTNSRHSKAGVRNSSARHDEGSKQHSNSSGAHHG